MTTDQLQYFITIVDTGSYIEAANELNLSQSSISKQIQALEKELGVSLFDRSYRKATLTREGTALLPEIRSLLAKMDHLAYSAAKLNPDYARQFHILSLPFIGYLGLYAPLGRFEFENPDYQLKVTEMEEPEMRRHVLNSSFDVAITYEYEYRLVNSVHPFFPICEDEIVCCVHHKHPLSACSSVSAQQLQGVPLLLMEPYTCVSKLCGNYFRQQDFMPDILFRGRPETIFGGAESNRGVALLTRKQASCYANNGVVPLPLNPSLKATVGAIVGKHNLHTQQAAQILQFLLECK